MSSIKPNNGSDEMNDTEEMASGFVIACGDGALLFEPGEEILDQMTYPIQVPVMAPLIGAHRAADPARPAS